MRQVYFCFLISSSKQSLNLIPSLIPISLARTLTPVTSSRYLACTQKQTRTYTRTHTNTHSIPVCLSRTHSLAHSHLNTHTNTHGRNAQKLHNSHSSTMGKESRVDWTIIKRLITSKQRVIAFLITIFIIWSISDSSCGFHFNNNS